MKKSIFKNYVFNLSYQILLIVSPLLVTPYVSRVLGAEGIGKYSFTQSIVSYFILLGTLGISMYAQREIAYVQDDKEKQSYIFWEIFIFKNVTIWLSIILFYFFIIRTSNYKILYLIQVLDIIAVLIDITWFFQGLEEFKKTVIRSFLIKVFSIILIFIFVKQASDLWKYILIYSGVSLLGQASLWGYLPKYLQKIKCTELKIRKHIKVIIQLFIPQIAMQIYLILDKTMIGIFTKSSYENGYYEQSQKLVKMCLTLVTALGTVMISRMSNAYANNDTKQVKEYLLRSFRFVLFLGFPIMFGLIGVSNNLVPWFFGNEFLKVSKLMMIFAPLILVIGLSNVIGVQYLIPTGKQKIFSITVFVGAVTNFILNLILIPQMQSMGAAIASVAAESIITLLQFIYIKNDISIGELKIDFFKYSIGGLIMFGIVKILDLVLVPSILNTFIMISFGGITYIIYLIVVKDCFLIMIVQRIANFFKRKSKHE